MEYFTTSVIYVFLGEAAACYVGLYELLSVLPVQLQAHVDSADDRSFLHTMFGERSLHSLVKVHEKLQHYEESCPAPVLDTAGALAQGVSIYIPYTLSLLPLSLSLLSVHDTVAQKSYEPELPPLPDDIDDDEDSVKIIRLVKNKEPLVSFSLFFFTILFRADAQSYILGVSRFSISSIGFYFRF
uniref:Membrane protein, palmitoylated 7a (MAGUK p55 subfamily member 7) n=1 Tax=Astyanax mexicanus TaxID=7994 RepID=A0A8B9JEM2_ASTMX